MLLADLTSDEFRVLRETCDTVLIPIGATEAHGCHLPLDTDTFIARRVCRQVGEQGKVLVAPAIPYGVCRSSGDHPGTVSITTTALRLLLLDLLESLFRQGLRRFLLLSGHAGGTHNATLVDVGEEFLRRHDEVRVAVVCEHELVMAAAGSLVTTPDDSHAGEIETSRLLFAAPERVRSQLPDAEWPRFSRWLLTRDKPAAWPGSVWGDPSAGTAAKGEQIEALVVAALLELVTDLRKAES